MSLRDSVEGTFSWARQRLTKIGTRYLAMLDEQVETIQHRLDDINQRLAEETVPEERKSRVGRLALERKAASVAHMASSVVRSRTRRTAPGAPESKRPAAETTGAAKNNNENKGATDKRGKNSSVRQKAARSGTQPKRSPAAGESTARRSRKSTGKPSQS